MKVLFLDIDGVLNSFKTTLLHGSLFLGSPDVAKRLDPYGSLFIKRLTQHGVKIVLSSTWRKGSQFEELGSQAFDFEVVGRTCIYPFAGARRGDEIKVWLDEHPEVTHYCIIDDDSDMLPEQMSHFVRIEGTEGITFADMRKICTVLGFDVWDLAAYRTETD